MPVSWRALRRTAVVGALTFGMSAGLLAAPASVAASGPDPVVTILGRGFGHGRGMSQWGAYGAAVSGLTWPEILQFYYPGTTQTTLSTGKLIRVLLSGTAPSELGVARATGLLLSQGTCITTLGTFTDASAFRVRRPAGAWVVERALTATGTWASVPISCPLDPSAPVDVRTTSYATTSVVTLRRSDGTSRAYRGFLRAVPAGSSSVQVVDLLPLEHYLWSVVPAEMPGGWAADALRAQAVAARTYAARRITTTGSYDICDTTTCQVYSGVSAEAPASTQAVGDTTGVTLSYGGAFAITEFSSSNGGWSVASALPYQLARPDPYDGAAPGAKPTWSTTRRASVLEAAYPAIGTLRSVAYAGTDTGWWHGWLSSVRLVGSTGSVVISGDTLRSVLGLRSAYAVLTTSGVGSDLARDLFPDLVAVGGSGDVLVYPTNGSGGWLPRRALGSGVAGLSSWTAAGDLDGDGFDDLLAVRSDGVLLLFSLRGGSLAASRAVGVGWSSMRELTGVGDVTGDGANDLLAVDKGGTSWVYPGNGRGGWLAKRSLGAAFSGLRELEAVGDLVGDGRSAVLGVDSAGRLTMTTLTVGGGVSARHTYGLGWSTMRLVGAGDVSGDGIPDLLAMGEDGVLYRYPGTGSGGWGPRATVGSGWFFAAVVS